MKLIKKCVSSAVILTLMLQVVACSSTTVVRSNDAAARIFVDGEYRGNGSISHSDQKIVGSTVNVTMKKEGCEPVIHTFNRNEEMDVGALIGGIFLLVPFLWIMKYKPDHNYEFRCIPTRS